jgi:hypothetical protein
MKNIYGVQMFIKQSLCYLENLDSLGLRHANRLKSWVGGYMSHQLFFISLCSLHHSGFLIEAQYYV